MNAWYQAQMPSLFSVDEGDDLCSYFSHSLLEDPDGASGISHIYRKKDFIIDKQIARYFVQFCVCLSNPPSLLCN